MTCFCRRNLWLRGRLGGNYIVNLNSESVSTYFNPSSESDKGRQESHFILSEIERWLAGLPSAGNQTGDGSVDKVGRTAVTGVFNL